MKILMLSNYFNHHQSPLCDALWDQTGGEFRFVETIPMPRERIQLGYPERKRDYVLRLEKNQEEIDCWIREADAVLAGSAPEALVRQRIHTGKLLYRMEERPLKEGLEPIKYLPRLVRWHWRNPPGKPVYLLCASAYTGADYRKFGLFSRKAYCWGYFPETRHQEGCEKLLQEKNTREILWCGRFLEWKHPETALEAARWLRDADVDFQMTFLGSGPLEAALKEKTAQYKLDDWVRFLGACPQGQVLRHMDRAGIFLFTSDDYEGWGVVVNEAMNSGCAVLGSKAAGAVPFLIQHDRNGKVFSIEDPACMYRMLRYLLEHPEEQKRLGRNAWKTITELWNAEEAARRLLALTAQLLSGNREPKIFTTGPCAPEDWGKR